MILQASTSEQALHTLLDYISTSWVYKTHKQR